MKMTPRTLLHWLSRQLATVTCTTWASSRSRLVRLIVAITSVALAGLLSTNSALANSAPANPAYGNPMRVDGHGLPTEVSAVLVTPRRGSSRRFLASRSVGSTPRRALRERQVESSFDALREQPGVMVQQTNRGAGIPIYRGIVGPGNLVMVDGLRFNQATWRTGPSQYLTLLDPSSFSKFEAMSGPASVRYGGGALGGVTSAQPWSFRSRPGFGARGGLRLVTQDAGTSGWLHVDGRRGNLAVSAGGALRNHGILRSGGGAEVPLSDWQQQAGHLQARWDISKRTTLDLLMLGSAADHAGRVDRLAQGRLRLYDNTDGFGAITLRHQGTGRLKQLRASLAMHVTNEDVARFDCIGSADLARCVRQADAAYGGRANGAVVADAQDQLKRDRRYHDEVQTLGGMASMAVWLLPQRLALTLGAEAWFDAVVQSRLTDARSSDNWESKQAARGNFSDDSSWLEAGTWAWLDAPLWQSGTLKLVAGGGARLAHFRGDAASVPGIGVVSYRHTGLVGAADLKLVSKRNWMAYLDVSQGFRAPNVQETTVLGDTGSKFEVPNADLAPERSLAVELGARMRSRTIELHVAAFANRVSGFIGEQTLTEEQVDALNLSDEDVANQPVVQRVNRDEGLFVGAQGQLTVRLPHGLSPWLKMGWTQGSISRDDGTTIPARRVPPLMGSAGLRWRKAKQGLWLEAFSRFAAVQDRLHPSDERDLRICADPANPAKTYAAGTCPGTPGWATLNVRGGWRWRRNLSLDVLLANALDTQYRPHGSGFDAPGVGLSISLTGRY
ncbi:MAG: TonB-dependent receptor [Myxococcales bacterium]|nr:TonB-dependent receptor [Myxococcales bacterium]